MKKKNLQNTTAKNGFPKFSKWTCFASSNLNIELAIRKQFVFQPVA
jgi:hypothetical protein